MILRNGTVFIDGRYQSTDIRIKDGKIVEIEPLTLDHDKLAVNEEVIDCSGKKIIPGLFDIHTHGCLSYDFSASSSDEIGKMCEFYASHGVTSILATTMTNEEKQYKNALSEIRVAMQRQQNAGEETSFSCQASIEGIYMEGPFFGPKKRGAHKESYLKPVSQELLEEYQELSANAIRVVAVDPTLENAMEFIEKNHEKYVITLAHTDCSYEVAKKAYEVGATHVTHLFNGMSPMNHREPGLAGAASQFRMNAEIICDGIHVHPAVIELMFRAMPEQMILISDAINPTGMGDGDYVAGGLPVTIRENKALLENGALAGSLITLFDAVKNAVAYGVPEEDAILSATYHPAKAVHLEESIGSIGIGKRADLLIVGENFELEKVILRGRTVNQKN